MKLIEILNTIKSIQTVEDEESVELLNSIAFYANALSSEYSLNRQEHS